MSEIELSDFKIARELKSGDERRVSSATCGGEETVRLTVFSAEISQRAEFRRALKTDRAMLAMLQHQSILKFLGSGESDGALFFWTEDSEFHPLSVHLSHGREFSAEDVIEIGWQICSALQQAHNRGLAHGGISTDTVLLSDILQVVLLDFGVQRWMKAGQDDMKSSEVGPALITVSALASREEVEKDLTDLAHVLKLILHPSGAPANSAEAERTSASSSLDRLLNRVLSSSPAQRPVSAREFQGRLGEILIGTDGDAMPLVDHRESQGTSRRSIIVELFDQQETADQIRPPADESAGIAWRGQILPILAGIVIIVILILLAELLI